MVDGQTKDQYDSIDDDAMELSEVDYSSVFW